MTFDADAWSDERALDERRRRPLPVESGVYATATGRALLGVVAVLFVATVVGLVALWPSGSAAEAPTSGRLGTTLPATVSSVEPIRCGPVDQACVELAVDVEGAGVQRLVVGGIVPDFDEGDRIRVERVVVPEGVEPGPGFEPYTFRDFDRGLPLLWLGVAFAVFAVALARWRGAFALLGTVLSVGLVVVFLVPALLEGSSPVLVSLVGAFAVMFVTLGLTYGVGAHAAAAALGIGLALLLATLLGETFTQLAHLDGSGSEVAGQLFADRPGLSLRGIVVAGMVIGALGVLADTAVSQVSTVMALRRSNPALGRRRLYAEAFTVGRDHLAATIHTLVLAYAGAALPLLLIVEASGARWTDALTTQELAEPVVATLVGALALVLAVPLTTALAAFVLHRVPAAALPDHHGHAH